jgi:hypothetical protein
MKYLFRGSWSRIASTSAALIAVIALLAPRAAQATPTPYIVKLMQQGSNVVATGSGEFNLTGLTYLRAVPLGIPAVLPADGYVGTGLEGSILSAYQGVSGPASFGSGGRTYASTETGDGAALNPSWYPSTLFVPQGYVSGTAIANSSVWNDASAASLGITPGIYTWAWGTAADQSFTLDAFTTVPEPAAIGMFGFGLLLLGGCLVLRRRQAGSVC